MLNLWKKNPLQFRVDKIPTSVELGNAGEQIAFEFLKKNGYRIVLRNFLAPLGRSRKGRKITGEIDLIGYDPHGILCFIEVKTRSDSEIALPESAVDQRKQRRIIRTARIYRRILALGEEPSRYDVVSIIAKPDYEPEVNLIKGYFSEEPYQRSGWWKNY